MLKEYIRRQAALIDRALDEMLPPAYPPAIYEAMRYSLFAGGKRLRPTLLMAAADAAGGDGTRYLRVAGGLEMIHTYSLIHDDLPAMDNDDYRRGKLTNHRAYGDGLAILAGDGLLTVAFETMLSQPGVAADTLVAVVREVAAAAGAAGMVGGQTVDLLAAGKDIDGDTLRYMHRAKTGALFKASIRAGAMLAGASAAKLASLTAYAEQFGLAFQITDDILDVTGDETKLGKPVGSDAKNNKVTYVSLYSLAEARQMAAAAVAAALEALEGFGPEAAVLRELVNYLLTRDN
jgi:Geranylgeranyl pyrophosphate synthase